MWTRVNVSPKHRARGIYCQDYLMRVSEITPSHVVNPLHSWIYDRGKIFSYNRTFDRK